MARPAVPAPLPRVPFHRLLRWARRSPVAWWVAAAAVAVLAATQVAGLDDDAEARRQAWGTSVAVAVAARDLGAGAVVGPDDVTVEQWPAAVVPAGALDSVPEGRTVAAPIVAGEAVVGARVAPEGLGAVAALVPEEHRAIAVPTAAGGLGTDAPPLAVGDRVDVLATFDVIDPSGADGGAPTGTVTAGAMVVDVGESAVTIAVPIDEVARVAFAVARGTVTLALVGAR